jgi:Amidohydrolase
VRLTFSFENEVNWPKDGTWDWYWPFAEKHDIPTMLLIPDAKPQLTDVLKRHPGLRVTVDHMGIRGGTKDAGVEPYIASTEALAQLPNVNVKLSNLPSFSTEKWPYANLYPYIERLVRVRCQALLLGRRPVTHDRRLRHALRRGNRLCAAASFPQCRGGGMDPGPRPLRVAALACLTGRAALPAGD